MIKISARSCSYGAKRDRKNVRYIVIHYTAGKGDSAQAEGNYFKNVNTRFAGAHFFVGQNGTIVKSIPLNRIAWAVGGARYVDCPQTGGGSMYGKVTNANSVSIELCDNLTRDPSDSQVNGVKKCIKHIRKYCPNAKVIVRHFDVTGKHCPARMMDVRRWESFLTKVNAGGTAPAPSAPASSGKSYKVKITVDELSVRSGPGTSYKVKMTVYKNEVYTIAKTKNGWGRLKSGDGWINCSSKYVRRV